jgi:hypothetical protein
MGETTSARAIAELMGQRLLALDFGGFADLFAEDGVFEYPFLAPGWPPVIHGREAIRAHLVESRRALRSAIELTAVDTTVHETTDPAVLVLEHVASGTTVATGASFEFASGVAVLTVRDGQVARYRDFTNPLGSAAVTGLLPDLVKRLAAQVEAAA